MHGYTEALQQIMTLFEAGKLKYIYALISNCWLSRTLGSQSQAVWGGWGSKRVEEVCKTQPPHFHVNMAESGPTLEWGAVFSKWVAWCLMRPDTRQGTDLSATRASHCSFVWLIRNERSISAPETKTFKTTTFVKEEQRLACSTAGMPCCLF